jgi:tripartite-type tricarboxylate transporter receptor subunit TctC
MNAYVGTKMKVVTGYPGGNEIALAIERGEVHGRCGLSWSSVKSTHPQWIGEKKVNILSQVSSAKHPDLTDVPSLLDAASTDEGRRVLNFLAARQAMGRPFMAPPELPPDRAAALRKAFMDTLRDPAFLTEADKAKLEINPVSGEHIDTLLKEMYATPADIVKKAAALMN